MDRVRELVLAMTAVALVCGIVKSVATDHRISSGIDFICGIFMVYTLLTFGNNVEIQFAENIFHEILADAQHQSDIGVLKRTTELAEVIKSDCETYILDKAEELGIAVTPEISVSHEDLPLPVSVILQGDASPDQKEMLCQLITEDLGIAKEDQLWSG